MKKKRGLKIAGGVLLLVVLLAVYLLLKNHINLPAELIAEEIASGINIPDNFISQPAPAVSASDQDDAEKTEADNQNPHKNNIHDSEIFPFSHTASSPFPYIAPQKSACYGYPFTLPITIPFTKYL